MMSLEQAREALAYIEPSFQRLRIFGPEDLSNLEILLEDKDTFIAAKAAYVISIIQDNRAIKLLEMAVKSRPPEVRIAIASGTKHLPQPTASEILLLLLDDPDLGVRKTALKAAREDSTLEVRTKIRELAATDPVDFIRNLSSDMNQRFIDLSP